MRKTIIAAILLASLIGCKENIKQQPIRSQIEDHTKPQEVVPTERYFLISYQYQTKDFETTGQGSTSFAWNNFPKKKEIDSLAYTMLPLESSCYKGVVILNIFEFKDKNDFVSYSSDYTNGTKQPKNKKQCK